MPEVIEKKRGAPPVMMTRRLSQTTDEHGQSKVIYHETLAEWCDRVVTQFPAKDEGDIEHPAGVAPRRWGKSRYHEGSRDRPMGIMVPGNHLYRVGADQELRKHCFRPILSEEQIRALGAELNGTTLITEDEKKAQRVMNEQRRREANELGMPMTGSSRASKAARIMEELKAAGITKETREKMLKDMLADGED